MKLAPLHANDREAHAALAVSKYPKVLFAGDPGGQISPAFAEDFARKLHDCRLVKLGSGIHFPPCFSPHGGGLREGTATAGERLRVSPGLHWSVAHFGRAC
jgi:hypothetical protein